MLFVIQVLEGELIYQFLKSFLQSLILIIFVYFTEFQ